MLCDSFNGTNANCLRYKTKGKCLVVSFVNSKLLMRRKMVRTGREISCHVIEIKYLEGYNRAKRLCQQIKTRVHEVRQHICRKFTTSPTASWYKKHFAAVMAWRSLETHSQVKFVARSWCLELYHIVSAWFNLLLLNLSSEKWIRGSKHMTTKRLPKIAIMSTNRGN